MDAWAFEEQLYLNATPPVSLPAETTALLACMRDLNMTGAQGLALVETYMREHPSASTLMRELPMIATVWVALVRACRVIGPGERGRK